MNEVGLYQAKTELSALIKGLEASGEPIAITRHGKVVAVISLPEKPSRVPGCLSDPEFHMADDFDAELPDFAEIFEEPQDVLVAEPKAKGYGKSS